MSILDAAIRIQRNEGEEEPEIKIPRGCWLGIQARGRTNEGVRRGLSLGAGDAFGTRVVDKEVTKEAGKDLELHPRPAA